MDADLSLMDDLGAVRDNSPNNVFAAGGQPHAVLSIGPPTIDYFYPTFGSAGTPVVITGTNFSDATSVRFGGIDASDFEINSDTQITATVGDGASGPVSVINPNGEGTSDPEHFFFGDPPTIDYFYPTSGGTGTSVTITGTNFTGATSVQFGGTNAAGFTVDSDTQITATVGNGSTGPVGVTTMIGTKESQSDFTYIAVYYVNIASGDDSNDGSALHPWKTLHHAVSQINGGSTGTYVLHLALGTYSVDTGEADAQLTLTQSAVTLIGESGTASVIDGTNAQNWPKGIEITGSNVRIKNLSVTGFSDTYSESEGEGIRISGGTGNEIRYCKIYGNSFGVRVSSATGSIIQECEIFNNSTHGIDIIWSTGTVVVRNIIHDNPKYGIRVESSSEISRNLIYDNDYGILVEVLNENSASPTIKNNVIYEVTSLAMSYGIFSRSNNYSSVNPKIYHNTIDGGTLDGIKMEKDGASFSTPIIKYNIITNFSQYGINNSGAGPTIEYNDVWNNTAGNYSGIDVISNTNINEDPKYASYSLQSDSPCINKIPSSEGDPVTLDYPGFTRPRPGKTTKDMGAYEYVANVTNNYTLPGGTGVATDYRIFTVPLKLGTGADMLTAMENVLGSYDPTHWRAFMYTGTLYREFNSSQFASQAIVPGMGFWIITTYTNQIPFEGGPAPDGVDYVMDLQPGWHLIGLPWTNTSIFLSSIKVTDGVNTYAISSPSNDLTQRKLWDYTGVNGYVERSAASFRLENNKGYFFKVNDKPVKLIVPNAVNLVHEPPPDVAHNQTNLNDDDEAPPPPPGEAPFPDIKANGQDGPVSVKSGDAVSVSVSLNPGVWEGYSADWWVAVRTSFNPPRDWCTYTDPVGWRPGIYPYLQNPLFQVTPSFEVLNMTLPVGNYIFYFAVDGNMDGEVDATWLDFVEVNVE